MTPEEELAGLVIGIPIITPEHCRNHEERFTARTRDGLCFCGSGKARSDCHADIHADSICAHVIYNLTDAEANIPAFVSEAHIRPYCEKACDYCYRDYFNISETEYFALRYSLVKDGTLQRKIAQGKNHLRRLQLTHPDKYRALFTETPKAGTHLVQRYHVYNACFFFEMAELPVPSPWYIKHRPLFYWLARDTESNPKYEDALSLPVEKYCLKYYIQRKKTSKGRRRNLSVWHS